MHRGLIFAALLVVAGCGFVQRPEDCNATTCRGCCNESGWCVSGDAPDQCGRGGAACALCQAPLSCQSGTCAAGGGTGGGVQGGTTGGTQGGTTGGTQGGTTGGVQGGTTGGIQGGTTGGVQGGTTGGVQGGTTGGTQGGTTGGIQGGTTGGIQGGTTGGIRGGTTGGIQGGFGGGSGGASSQIAAVRRAIDDGQTSVALPINGALVTSLKPLVPGAGQLDPSGFFLQASPTGPAIFVAVDPSTAGGGLQVGDRIELTTSYVGTLGGVRTILTVGSLTRIGRGQPVDTLVQVVSRVDFSATRAVEEYESELVSISGTARAFAASGSGYLSAPFDTAGTPSAGAALQVRLPVDLGTAEELDGCGFGLSAVPLWRSSTQAQPSLFESSELQSVVCPAPRLLRASAVTPTSVRVSFDRTMATPPSPASFSINQLSVSTAVASGRDISLTTSPQTSGANYRLSANSSVTDVRGTPVDAAANSATFTGLGTTCHPAVIISQVYPGGGSSGASFVSDFVELHNRSGTSVDLSGWSLQYTSLGGSSWIAAPLRGTVNPGRYFLVELAPGGVGTLPVTPDHLVTLSAAATSGKLALTTSSVALSGSCPTSATIVDLVGYGLANCYEGTGAAPPGTPNTSLFRVPDSCSDTDDNGNDFSPSIPSLRNSQTTPSTCQCR